MLMALRFEPSRFFLKGNIRTIFATNYIRGITQWYNDRDLKAK